MVKNWKQVFNSFELAAVFLALIIYTGLVPVKESTGCSCLIPTAAQNRIVGKVVSNPVKNTARQVYECDFVPEISYSKDGLKSTCRGKIRISLPSACAEAYFPGKLYSASKTFCGNEGVLCETGARLELQGSFSNDGNVFFVRKAEQLPWCVRTVSGKISYFRALCRLQFRRIMFFWNDAGGLFLALVSGMREYTDKSVCDSFRTAGLSHILALSGMHLSLFSGFTKKISNKTAGKHISSIFQVVTVCLFVWFAGLSPSLFRAFLCNILCFLCELVNIRTVKMTKILSVSFVIHIIIFPGDIFKLAFMLSYGALAGILMFGDFFMVPVVRILPPVFSTALTASAGAQCFTAPITAITLGTISPIGIISSVIISPLITFFIYAGLFLIVLSFVFPFTAPAAAFFMKILYTATIKGVSLFASVPSILVKG